MFLGVVADQNMVPKKDSSKTKHRKDFYFKLSIPYNYVWSMTDMPDFGDFGDFQIFD